MRKDTMSTHMTLDNLLHALAIQGSDSPSSHGTVDEMDHSGKAGVSFVERWRLVSPVITKVIGIEAPEGAGGGVWLWRVRWIPRRERGPRWKHQFRPVLIAHGISKEGEPGAQKAGRKAATRLAKERRAAAKLEADELDTCAGCGRVDDVMEIGVYKDRLLCRNCEADAKDADGEVAA